jgi:hypothetical protein
MIRVLDWGLRSIGQYVVVGRHETDHGVYYNVTWPGFAGVLTAMAPGRFSAAINQAPRQMPFGMRWLDEVIVHLGMYRTLGTIPVAHLLRRVFEEAADYQGAQDMLMDESIDLAMPALFTLSGVEAEESCVIEAIGRKRFLNAAVAAPDGIVGVANNWLTPGLPGVARDNSLAWSKHTTTTASNQERRSTVCDLQRRPFAGVADLTPPVLNGHTVLVATANARQGTLTVEALDHGGDRHGLPHVVSHARIGFPESAVSAA